MKCFLLTDGEFTGLIRTLRSLDENVKIVGFCEALDVAHSKMLDKTYIAPSVNDNLFFDFLYDVIKKEKINYIFPVATNSLEYYATIKNKLYDDLNVKIISSDYDIINIVNNKYKLFDFLSKCEGTKDLITKFAKVSTYKELRDSYYNFIKEGYEVVTKPVIGENAEGFLKFVDKNTFVKLNLEGKTSNKTTISLYDDFKNEEKLDEERIVMPFLDGDEYDVDVLCLNGEILNITMRKNLDMFGGISSKCITIFDEKLFDYSKRIVKKLNYSYVACISLKKDKDGNLKLLEINPRTMGSIHLSTMAGNSLIKELLNILDGNYKTRETIITKEGFKSALYYDIINV